MAELFMGLYGAVLGLLLWEWGRREGCRQAAVQEPKKPTPPTHPLSVQAMRERYNFLNFEGDEMRPAQFPAEDAHD